MNEEKTKKKSLSKELADTLSDKAASAIISFREAESFPNAIKKALGGRENVLMLRINEESLNKVDELVESGLFKSRSESAAFLLREGIKARSDLYDKLSEKVRKIQSLKEELKELIEDEIKIKEENQSSK